MPDEPREDNNKLGVRYYSPFVGDRSDYRAQARAAIDGQILRNRGEYVVAWLLQPLMFLPAVLSLMPFEPVRTVSDGLANLGSLSVLAAVSLGAAMFTRARVIVHPGAFTVVNLFRTYYIPDGNVVNASLEPTGFPTVYLADGTDITIAALQESPIRQFFGGTVDSHAFNYVLARGEHYPPRGPVTMTRLRWNTAQKALAAVWIVIAAANITPVALVPA